MAYPVPNEGGSAERLYKEAMFFYNQYEEQKAKWEELKKWLVREIDSNDFLSYCGVLQKIEKLEKGE